MSKRIRVASQFNESINDIIRQRADVDVIRIVDGIPTELPKNIDVLFIRPWLEAGQFDSSQPPTYWQDVKWIQIPSVGWDKYPRWLFPEKVVTSAHGLSAEAIAEFSLALILTAVKGMPDVWIHQAEQWTDKPRGLLSGKSIGILGYGAIARALIKRLQPFDVKILVKRFSDEIINTPNVHQVNTIEQLFAESDHLVLAAPVTPYTQHIVNSNSLAHAKKSLHLINIARGGLIDEEALLAGLDSGQIALASLDVTEIEPLPDNHPFYTHPKVRLSPHISFGPSYIENGLVPRFIDNLQRFKLNEKLLYQINVERGY